MLFLSKTCVFLIRIVHAKLCQILLIIKKNLANWKWNIKTRLDNIEENKKKEFTTNTSKHWRTKNFYRFTAKPCFAIAVEQGSEERGASKQTKQSTKWLFENVIVMRKKKVLSQFWISIVIKNCRASSRSIENFTRNSLRYIASLVYSNNTVNIKAAEDEFIWMLWKRIFKKSYTETI